MSVSTSSRGIPAQLKKNDDGSYTLDMDAIGLLRGMLGADAQQGGGSGAAGGLSPSDILMAVGQMIPDLKVTRQFTLPGTIVETNGKKSEDGKTVTWTFASSDLAAAAGDVSKAPGKMTVRFKGEGLTLTPFTYTPDLSEVMKAMQPKPPTPATPAEPKKPDEPKPPPEPTTPPK